MKIENEETKKDKYKAKLAENLELKPIPMLTNGRKQGFYRERLCLYEWKTSIKEMKKAILKIDKRRDISAVIYFTSPNFNDTNFIDFLFSRRLTGLQLEFAKLQDQNLLNHIANKIEEHSNSLFEIV